MRDDPTVVDLVDRARQGDKAAWDRIVERYAPLVWATCRRHGLGGADIDDVGATTWLRLVEHLETLREPAALPGWLATTATRECLQVLRRRSKVVLPEDGDVLMDTAEGKRPMSTDPGELDASLLREERRIALREAFAELSERCRSLLELLFAEPRQPYAQIGETLGVAIGAIGPMRQRCLDRLRRSKSLAAFGKGVSDRVSG